MKRRSVQTLVQVAVCLLCAIVAAEHFDLTYMEFGGGTFTGTLVKMNSSGGLLFIVAMILTFIYPRMAAICALAALLLCLPLYLYLVAPGLAQWIFPGEYSARSQSIFVWDDWALAGILSLALLAYVWLRTSLPRA